MSSVGSSSVTDRVVDSARMIGNTYLLFWSRTYPIPLKAMRSLPVGVNTGESILVNGLNRFPELIILLVCGEGEMFEELLSFK